MNKMGPRIPNREPNCSSVDPILRCPGKGWKLGSMVIGSMGCFHVITYKWDILGLYKLLSYNPFTNLLQTFLRHPSSTQLGILVHETQSGR